MSDAPAHLTSAKESIARLVKICAIKGIKYVVISPGSRNAALTLSFAEDPRFDCLNIADERVAAFFAMGIAQKTKQPVILCCTSGTAALNYAPAIAEAYHQKIPLLILTADRPIEWIDQRAGQTMKQKNLYANYIKKSFELFEEPKQQEHLWFNDRIVNEAINISTTGSHGPVHINVPMREPLYELVPASTFADPKIINKPKLKLELSILALSEIRKEWAGYKSVLVIVGQRDHDPSFDKAIDLLAQLPQVIVLTETTSNVQSQHVLPSIDRVIDSIDSSEYGDFTPALVISCGAAIVSKKIRFMLRQMDVTAHWHVDADDGYIDTYQALTRLISVEAEDLFTTLVQEEVVGYEAVGREAVDPEANRFKSIWLDREEHTKSRHTAYLKQSVWSDLQVISDVLAAIPAGVLHLSSSTPIRYAQLFAHRSDLLYKCNRGVSGIDGCTSTAAGYAYVHDGWVTLITGDLAFFYDSNGLWHPHLDPKLRIIMINNEGGNIFRYVNGPDKTKHLEQHFEATHQTSAKLLAETYGVGYFRADDRSSLQTGIKELFDESLDCAAVLEVYTPRTENIDILKDYFQFLKKNIGQNHS